MAVLTSGQRAELWAEMMRELSRVTEACAITKTDLRAAVDATDQWIDDNGASFNNALPTAAKNNLTAGQKKRLFLAVALKRFEV